jgi:FADH2 O2-dependent halogenase
MTKTCDVLIIGSGFGGCLLAALLQRQGQQVVVIDRNQHPRFAIGESSTPLADQTLHQIASAAGLPELLPLCRYGSWKRVYPDLTCGLKRGFSYFDHTCGKIETRQLLVAASHSDERSDTHWLRSDVDAFIARTAVHHGATLIEGAEFELRTNSGHWQVSGVAGGRSFSVRSQFVVDASGPAGVVMNHLGIVSQTNRLKTQSSAVYGHFRNVRSNRELLLNADRPIDLHPFDCDAAAVHHVLPDGWMWQLRFDDQTVSAGLMIQGRSSAAAQVWIDTLKRYPFLRSQFATSELIRVPSLQTTGRVQRLRQHAAGANWAALPSTAGFIDPLHSTGIAHTLFGVRRIAEQLGNNSWSAAAATEYSRTTIDELLLIDELVEGCYAALPSFRLLSAWSMLYFAAVTSMEQNGIRRSDFLRAADTDFQHVLKDSRSQLQATIKAGSREADIEQFERWLKRRIEPWNHVGLFDSPDGMYASTAAQ